MNKPTSSTPAKAAAARVNGRKGGTKSPDISRWNAVQHGLTARNLTIHEGRHLPEYGQFAAMRGELLKELSGLAPLSIDEYLAVDKFVGDAWRVARAYRFELSETEKHDNGMLSPAMASLLRYMSLANRQLDESFARVQEIRKQKEAAAAKQVRAAMHHVRADAQTASEPAALGTVSQTAPMSTEFLGTTPTTDHTDQAGQGEQPADSQLPTTATSAVTQPGDPMVGTPEQAVHAAADAETAQNEEEENSENPG